MPPSRVRRLVPPTPAQVVGQAVVALVSAVEAQALEDMATADVHDQPDPPHAVCEFCFGLVLIQQLSFHVLFQCPCEDSTSDDSDEETFEQFEDSDDSGAFDYEREFDGGVFDYDPFDDEHGVGGPE